MQDNLTAYLTIKEVASQLGVHRFSVYRWVNSKKLPAIRIGKLWKISPQTLSSFLYAKSNSKLRAKS